MRLTYGVNQYVKQMLANIEENRSDLFICISSLLDSTNLTLESPILNPA